MAEATDDELLAAIIKLRSARAQLQAAFKAKDTADREQRSAHEAFNKANHAAAVARHELDKLMDEDAR